ncbi:MAG: DNA/RNA non-specific endonuclease [Bacteroidota bacterium]|nr:DNA/RNA non-specific endonuclease [Bacteroidota bacterium]
MIKNLVLLFFITNTFYGQNIDNQIFRINSIITLLKKQQDSLYAQLEGLKLEKIRNDLFKMGFPASEEIIMHSAMALAYSEPHEQAIWVAHIIIPEVSSGTNSRTNDFRPDSLIKTGSADEADYFSKKMKSDSSGYEYDGYGYDRGHLAPSADFKWSRKALSESYFYSNISPQVAQLNRGKWAELEDMIRGYVYIKKTTQLYVVTGPVLDDNLPKIPRAINKVSIPEWYYKVVIDTVNKQGIGFMMKNIDNPDPVETYAVSIDHVESVTGLNFFPNLTSAQEKILEKEYDPFKWVPESQAKNVMPIPEDMLPRNTFNTLQAKLYMGKNEKVTICGTVVGTHKSKKGNIFINLDKKFPSQIFTAAIWTRDAINFSYEPHRYLMDKKVCFTGVVTKSGDVPQMNIINEYAIKVIEE